MRFFKPLSSILIAALVFAAPAPSSAQIYVSLFGPPPIPQYTQPPVPAPGYMWTPGYWAMGPAGYYWVPGTWVQPPQANTYWTPGYWGYNGNQYAYNQGYWGPQVGYYGGINYGAGFYGNGYVGGMWQGPTFAYNTAVSNVPQTIVNNNTYVNRTVIVHNNNYTSYNGGRGGVVVRPTSQQLAYAHQQHIGLTPVQREHIQVASQNRNYLASVNHGKPADPVVARPLSSTNRPADFKPVTADDKANAQKATAPQHTEAKPEAQAHPQSHPDQAHPQPAHPEQAHPEQAHPEQAHPEHPATHPPQAHPQQAHPQQAHPAPAHPQPAHPEQAHPEQAHPDQAHPDEHPTHAPQ